MYKLNPLILLERRALRLCLGLPKYTANNILYLESRLPALESRFKLLTALTMLRIFESPLSRDLSLMVARPALFFNSWWPHQYRPQCVYAQTLLSPLNINIPSVMQMSWEALPVPLTFNNIFPNNAKRLPTRLLTGLLNDYLSNLDTYVVVATDASQLEERAGVGIFSPQLNWSFSIRLPDFTPIFYAEFMAIVIALKKLPPQILNVVIVSDSLAVCSSLISPKNSALLRTFGYLVPSHLREIRLIWVPGHKGLYLNEEADSLARSALDGPPFDVCPFPSILAGARIRRHQHLARRQEDAITSLDDYAHLAYAWDSRCCESRQCEVTLTSLRCRVPQLNFYMHRAGLTSSRHCALCDEPETLEHFFLHCRGFSSMRRKYLVEPIHHLGLTLSMPVLLSFGAISLGSPHRNLVTAVHTYVSETRRLPC